MRRSVLVTEAIENSFTLLDINNLSPAARKKILFSVVDAIKKMHQNHFMHNDIRLRNILTEGENIIFLRLSKGRIYPWMLRLFENKRRIKDCALLYEDLKNIVSKTIALRAYKRNIGLANAQKNTRNHKKQISKILSYY